MNTHADTLSAADHLMAEFFAYVRALPFTFQGDAEELHTDPRITQEQRAWVADFIGRWEFAQSREDVLARFEVGETATDATHVGALVLSGSDEAGFTLFVNGGALPNGEEAEHFFGPDAALRALDEFHRVARMMSNDALDL